MILSFIRWDIDPAIFSIGDFEIRWYGLLFATSFYLGYIVLGKIFKKEGVDQKVLDNLTIWMIVGTIIGARLGHVFFYEPDYYLSNPVKILYLREGGLASHGAAISIIVTLWLFSKFRTKKSFWWLIDRMVIVVALAGLFIRSGNLMNSEIVGKPTDVAWGFIFVRLGENFARHPAQIYEALSYTLIFFVLYRLYQKNYKVWNGGMIFGLFLILLFTARFIIEFFKANQVEFEDNLALNMGQWLSIPFVLILSIVMFLSSKGIIGKEKS